jgi:hypothetical protein
MSAGYQLGPFELGQVKAHAYYGLSAAAIARIVTKPDGTYFTDVTILRALAKISGDPAWRGERQAGSGRSRKTAIKLDSKIAKMVLKRRGEERVTVSALRSKFPELRSCSRTLVEERLHEAGLLYLRRRRKTLVPKKYKEDRLAFARWVMRRHDSTLEQWAYSDGTVFYLERTQEENEHGHRRSLGSSVWRRADRSDALYEDCVGPSSYAKAQGTPVQVWGLLAGGYLRVYTLPEAQSMNRWWYAWLVEKMFPKWLGECKYLVQDFERCLRCEETLQAMKAIGLSLVDEYPKSSQDLNAIENAWNLLRVRLDATRPTNIEPRAAFIKRLRSAVEWLNKNKHHELWELSTNQKQRAKDVLDLGGSRTKW